MQNNCWKQVEVYLIRHSGRIINVNALTRLVTRLIVSLPGSVG